jgi:hypothetical protein
MKAHELITNPRHFTTGTLARDSKGKPCGTAPEAKPVSFDCLGAIFWCYPEGKHREPCRLARELAQQKYGLVLGRLDHDEALTVLKAVDV